MSLLSLPERLLQRLVELPLELFSMILGSQKALKMSTSFPTGQPIGPSVGYDTPLSRVAAMWGGGGFINSHRYDPAGKARRERKEIKRIRAHYRDLGLHYEEPGTTPIPLPSRQHQKGERGFNEQHLGYDSHIFKKQTVPRLFVL